LIKFSYSNYYFFLAADAAGPAEDEERDPQRRQQQRVERFTAEKQVCLYVHELRQFQ
jgi:hypothetical protein